MKKVNESVDELTKKEISLVETNDRLAKLEKDKQRKDKLIAEYKEREKQSARALVLYERKIKWIKETIIDDILKVCKDVEAHKAEYLNQVNKVLNQEMKEDFRSFSADFTLIVDDLYEVCNKIESGATITQSDRDFISNKKEVQKQPEKLDSDARFDILKKQFDQKIGASVLRKPGRPKKSDQSIVSEIGLGKNPENKIKEADDVQEKLNNIFYETPEDKKIVSNIPKTEDSVFDFNEALNPDISLKSIMADIMQEKPQDSVKNYDLYEQTQEIKKAQKKSKIELLEAGIFRKPMFFEDTKQKNENVAGSEESNFSDEDHVVNYSGKINSSRGTSGIYDNQNWLNGYIEDIEKRQQMRNANEASNNQQKIVSRNGVNDDEFTKANASSVTNLRNVEVQSHMVTNTSVANENQKIVEPAEPPKPKLTFEQKFMPLKDLINDINDDI